ncbi:hypothetical protein B0H14DRAFT_2932893 [Mycena olivaceomarginata]|nr:hypothetical protein B0H14DRAFT_2932893 [Mycena olivaceomarginata]
MGSAGRCSATGDSTGLGSATSSVSGATRTPSPGPRPRHRHRQYARCIARTRGGRGSTLTSRGRHFAAIRQFGGTAQRTTRSLLTSCMRRGSLYPTRKIHGVFGHEKKANSRSRAYCATARTHPQDPACAGGARDSPRHRHRRGRNTSGLRTALGGLHTTADAGGRAAALRSRSKTRLAPTEVPHAGGHVHSFTFRRGQRRDGSTFILTSPRTDSRRCDPFFEGGGEGWDPRGPDRARHGGPSGQDRYGVAVGWAKVPTRRHGAVYPGHCPRLRVTMGE